MTVYLEDRERESGGIARARHDPPRPASPSTTECLQPQPAAQGSALSQGDSQQGQTRAFKQPSAAQFLRHRW
ncbi:hypothetical protein E2C01_044897 [Portunus trituberculatus]|uniref:Uncharacterized protein n=1 Tax=Portunus trituberculatus TaxID=210409 RepID=A0A5B7FTB6_PORTR|nr:hypothetical protein [Portunus trituberculatus]